MSVIILETYINAPIEEVFDLARSVDMHLHSTRSTNERAVGGRTTGLMQFNETVTWRAKHLGFYQELTSKITEFEFPYLFSDTMVKGAFAYMHHEHTFVSLKQGTLMKDNFEFRSPFGMVGRVFDFFFLRNYMLKFLKLRNKELKKEAELS